MVVRILIRYENASLGQVHRTILAGVVVLVLNSLCKSNTGFAELTLGATMRLVLVDHLPVESSIRLVNLLACDPSNTVAV